MMLNLVTGYWIRACLIAGGSNFWARRGYALIKESKVSNSIHLDTLHHQRLAPQRFLRIMSLMHTLEYLHHCPKGIYIDPLIDRVCNAPPAGASVRLNQAQHSFLLSAIIRPVQKSAGSDTLGAYGAGVNMGCCLLHIVLSELWY
jgi:hypothetical protein